MNRRPSLLTNTPSANGTHLPLSWKTSDSSASAAAAPSPGPSPARAHPSVLFTGNVPLHAKSSSHVRSFKKALRNCAEPGRATRSFQPFCPISRSTAWRATASFCCSLRTAFGLMLSIAFFARSSANAGLAPPVPVVGRGRTAARASPCDSYFSPSIMSRPIAYCPQKVVRPSSSAAFSAAFPCGFSGLSVPSVVAAYSMILTSWRWLALKCNCGTRLMPSRNAVEPSFFSFVTFSTIVTPL